MKKGLPEIGFPDKSFRICPTCESKYNEEQSTALPFCSLRCQQIDLGRWFNEEHSVPHVPSEEELERMLEESE